MATHHQPPLPETDPEIALAGWDPYIVAITGDTIPAELVPSSANSAGRNAEDNAASMQSRELRLMAWLRDQGNAG